MLPRILTGTLLSIACILTVQAAEIAFDKAIEELDTALAAPAEVAAELSATGDCDVPDHLHCDEEALLAGELTPEIDAYLDCLGEEGNPDETVGGTA